MPHLSQAHRFRIEPLGPRHIREDFACGIEALDNYLQRQARQDVKKHAAAVFVLTPDGRTIAGYYTLSQFSVELDALPQEIARKLPKYPVAPATLIGRLAVSTAFRGQKLGELLFMDALKRCSLASREIASTAVIVDAKDEAAAAFYKKYGFLELPRIPTRLFMPMATIDKMFA